MAIRKVRDLIGNKEMAIISAYRDVKENVRNLHMTADDGKQIGDKYSYDENRERQRDFNAVLLRLGYGVAMHRKVTVGVFGKPDASLLFEDCSIVLNQNNLPYCYDNVFMLSEYYNQDGFCYKMNGSTEEYLVGTNDAKMPGYGNRIRICNVISKQADDLNLMDFDSFDYRRHGGMGLMCIHVCAEKVMRKMNLKIYHK